MFIVADHQAEILEHYFVSAHDGDVLQIQERGLLPIHSASSLDDAEFSGPNSKLLRWQRLRGARAWM
jgi:hypothetical protein